MRLVGFAGHQEEALGTIERPVKIGDETVDLSFFVSEGANKPILGVDSLKKLGFTLDCTNGVLQRPNKERVFCHVVESAEERAAWTAGKAIKND